MNRLLINPRRFYRFFVRAFFAGAVTEFLFFFYLWGARPSVFAGLPDRNLSDPNQAAPFILGIFFGLIATAPAYGTVVISLQHLPGDILRLIKLMIKLHRKRQLEAAKL